MALWDAQKIIHRLNGRVQQEPALAVFRPFLSHPEFAQRLAQVLERAASFPDFNEGIGFVYDWLKRQEQSLFSSLPADSFWSLLSPLFVPPTSPFAPPATLQPPHADGRPPKSISPSNLASLSKSSLPSVGSSASSTSEDLRRVARQDGVATWQSATSSPPTHASPPRPSGGMSSPQLPVISNSPLYPPPASEVPSSLRPTSPAWMKISQTPSPGEPPLAASSVSSDPLRRIQRSDGVATYQEAAPSAAPPGVVYGVAEVEPAPSSSSSFAGDRAPYTPKKIPSGQIPILEPKSPPASSNSDKRGSSSWDQWEAAQQLNPTNEAETIEKMVALLRASPLSKWVDPGKFEKFLQKKFSSFVGNLNMDLDPIRQVMHKTQGTPADLIDEYVFELHRHKWPWEAQLPKDMQVRLHTSDPSRLRKAPLSANGVLPAEPPRPSSASLPALERLRASSASLSSVKPRPSSGNLPSFHASPEPAPLSLTQAEPNRPFPSGSWDQWDVAPVSEPLDAVIKHMVAILSVSSIAQAIDPSKFEGFLKKKLATSLTDDQRIDLSVIRKVMLKTPQIDPEQINLYLLQVVQTARLPYEFLLPSEISSPSSYDSSSSSSFPASPARPSSLSSPNLRVVEPPPSGVLFPSKGRTSSASLSSFSETQRPSHGALHTFSPPSYSPPAAFSPPTFSPPAFSVPSPSAPPPSLPLPPSRPTGGHVNFFSPTKNPSLPNIDTVRNPSLRASAQLDTIRGTPARTSDGIPTLAMPPQKPASSAYPPPEDAASTYASHPSSIRPFHPPSASFPSSDSFDETAAAPSQGRFPSHSPHPSHLPHPSEITEVPVFDQTVRDYSSIGPFHPSPPPSYPPKTHFHAPPPLPSSSPSPAYLDLTASSSRHDLPDPSLHSSPPSAPPRPRSASPVSEMELFQDLHLMPSQAPSTPLSLSQAPPADPSSRSARFHRLLSRLLLATTACLFLGTWAWLNFVPSSVSLDGTERTSFWKSELPILYAVQRNDQLILILLPQWRAAWKKGSPEETLLRLLPQIRRDRISSVLLASEDRRVIMEFRLEPR